MEIDPDAPIPYRLTALGHREVANIRLEEHNADCRHEWRVERGTLVCRHCDLTRDLQRSASIPTYLAPKRRGD